MADRQIIDRMKILHTVGGFSAAGGGITSCLCDLLTALQDCGDEVEMLTVDHGIEVSALTDAHWLKTVPMDYKTPVAWSINLSKAIAESDADVYHSNGLWMHVNHLTAKKARKAGRPLVITPHGMLFPDALHRSAWKKHILRKLWFDKDIRCADAIHVTCEKERQAVELFGYKGRIELIPNPLVIPDYIEDIVRDKKPQEGKVLGFLGRLHPVKGIEYLIDALALASDKSIRLSIMGSGQPEYEKSLRERVKERGLNNRVDFVGQVSGRDKFERLSRLSALMVPSDFENFGMIVPEALIVETPVMASVNTPWESLNSCNAGWWCSREPAELARLIDQIAEMSPSELREMGANGAKMARESFDAKVVAKSMTRLYHSL